MSCYMFVQLLHHNFNALDAPISYNTLLYRLNSISPSFLWPFIASLKPLLFKISSTLAIIGPSLLLFTSSTATASPARVAVSKSSYSQMFAFMPTPWYWCSVKNASHAFTTSGCPSWIWINRRIVIRSKFSCDFLKIKFDRGTVQRSVIRGKGMGPRADRPM